MLLHGPASSINGGRGAETRSQAITRLLESCVRRKSAMTRSRHLEGSNCSIESPLARSFMTLARSWLAGALEIGLDTEGPLDPRLRHTRCS